MALTKKMAIEPARRAARVFGPPANGESAINPVIVSVITFVARSGMPQRRTMAFCTPMPKARMPVTQKRGSPWGPAWVTPVTTVAATRATHSTAKPTRCRPRAPGQWTSRPPTTAPTANVASTTRYGKTERWAGVPSVPTANAR